MEMNESLLLFLKIFFFFFLFFISVFDSFFVLQLLGFVFKNFVLFGCFLVLVFKVCFIFGFSLLFMEFCFVLFDIYLL